MNRSWTNEQLEFVKKNYPEHGITWCSEKLGKTYNAIKGKVQVLKLQSGFRVSNEDGAIIRANLHLHNREIAEQLGIKEHRVRNYVHRHKLRPATWTQYTAAETEFVKNNYTQLSWREIADAIGRTEDSVHAKAQLLKLKRSKEQLRAILRRTAAHTYFQKGHAPHNTKYNGAISQRTNNEGITYKYIRISKANWQLLHIHNWEKQNGPVPQGQILRSINGNQLDCDPTNWVTITRAAHIGLNNNGRDTLDDKYIIKLLSRRKPELEPLIAAQPELIELKRNQLKLGRAINEHND